MFNSVVAGQSWPPLVQTQHSGEQTMMEDDHKRLDEGGAKEQSSDKDPRTSNSELSEENSQALKNQGTANPGEYPDREETPT